MAGLVPAIHVFCVAKTSIPRDVRDDALRPGHDQNIIASSVAAIAPGAKN
jgi:hypothetical protein